jgi:hypothetical protein
MVGAVAVALHLRAVDDVPRSVEIEKAAGENRSLQPRW